MTNYPGIDYSLGKSNVNEATGIHYGVISQNSISPEALDDIYFASENLSYKVSVSEFKNRISACENLADLEGVISDVIRFAKGGLQEIVFPLDEQGTEKVWSLIEDDFNDGYQSDDHDWLYEKDGHKLTNCLQSDIFVLESPFYTLSQFCSPCVPGAGNLDSPCPDGPRTYCLSHDYFEGGVAPYPVFSVADDTKVVPERI